VSALSDEIQTSVDEHSLMITALRAGDAYSAESALQANWYNALQRLEHVIARIGERGTW
jgi:DNA-binding GntR family transcriptional regulator